jgi:hypothetical protein
VQKEHSAQTGTQPLPACSLGRDWEARQQKSCLDPDSNQGSHHVLIRIQVMRLKLLLGGIQDSKIRDETYVATAPSRLDWSEVKSCELYPQNKFSVWCSAE